MASFIDPILDSVDSFLAWLSSSLKQTTESYCEIETADSPTTLVSHDGSLISIIRIIGVTNLLGTEEFKRLRERLTISLQTAMSQPGHALQVYFNYDMQAVVKRIERILEPARQTAKRLHLDLEDVFNERVNYLSKFCAYESVHFVLWTKPTIMKKDELKRALKQKQQIIKDNKIPPFRLTQNVVAPIGELRNAHDAFVRGTITDLETLNIATRLLKVHDAVRAMRNSVDPDFTGFDWEPQLPGDKIYVKDYKKTKGDLSDVLWPSLAKQIMPRDAENLDLRTVRIGDRVYATVFIDLFPKEIKTFINLFSRVLAAKIPWRISFAMESDGISALKFKSLLSSILSFSSSQNRLISDASNLLKYINLTTDNAVVKLKVAACTWAPDGNINLLRTRASELAKAIEGWGGCDVSEICGDAFAGIVSTMLGVSSENVAATSVAPLSDVMYMLPITRPASPWSKGAQLFRTPDGKPWPYQPGSSEQTTYIDLFYARPGSGKSVLSNTINLALCLSAGMQRLPRIAIIDIGPSSSGLISLLKEALPQNQRHLAAYHRLRMTPDYSINPFDNQLGNRFPTPEERAFLVNFLTLLATPVGSEKPYDGVPGLAGMVVDELYKALADDGKPYNYTTGIEPLIDGILEEIGFVKDQRTTWWEVTDALFLAGFIHEAHLAQRYSMPLLADCASICRSQPIEDLYGKIITPTGENLINAFSRMISSAVREYPILSRVTAFDLGDARVVALDLDEVAKSGGDAANRQTAVMYMLARYVLARHYYLNEANLEDMPERYKDYHRKRIAEIREDPKRLVYDEFHRTAKSDAVREQVIVDMREGRKWKVQVALASQSIDDFDPVMIEFATSIYILDAGPAQSVNKTTEIFGLTPTARTALTTRVHGPRPGGATFLAQYATKYGLNTQLLTATLGPVELWAFSTTPEDAQLRNKLYKRLGPKETRRVLANLFPSGSVKKVIEARLNALREETGLIEETASTSIADQLLEEILEAYAKNPNVKSLPLKEANPINI
ncbi:MAG: type IV secretion protein IcmB [Pseudomonadota bacterium]